MFEKTEKAVIEKASKIKLVLTDCDGVLTDTGVYYGSEGEIMKRFSIRDGMGVERLKNICKIETGIITGETSGSVAKRAEKLKIQFLYLGIKNKLELLDRILLETGVTASEIAYIGDDVNDLDIIAKCGLKVCPGDAMFMVKEVCDYICVHFGGNGAFREMAELIIYSKTHNENKN